MGRGFLSGLFWGLVAVIFGAWGLSQLGGQTVVLGPPEADVEAVTTTPLSQTETDGQGDVLDVGADEPVTLAAEGGSDAVSAPQSEAIPQADRQGAAQPETGEPSPLGDPPGEPVPALDAVTDASDGTQEVAIDTAVDE